MLGTIISAFISKFPKSRHKRQIVSTVLGFFPSVPVRSRYGVRIYSDSKDLTNMFSILGEYDDVYHVVSSLRPEMAFIDIGANAGVFSMIAGERLGEDGVIVAFEPSYAVFKKLIANASVNKLRNFFPFMAAVGPSIGVERLKTNEKHTGAAHLDAQGDTRIVQLGGPAICKLLSNLVESRRIMIKIDVEGAELDVVRSIGDFLDSDSIETIVVEVNAKQYARFDATPKDLYHFMQQKGYESRLGLGFGDHYNETFSR
jgi:FkbM family methyltransferase